MQKTISVKKLDKKLQDFINKYKYVLWENPKSGWNKFPDEFKLGIEAGFLLIGDEFNRQVGIKTRGIAIKTNKNIQNYVKQKLREEFDK